MSVFRLPAGLAPGGLVFVLYDGADVELERTPVAGVTAAHDYLAETAERHAEQILRHGGVVRLFDGDTGRMVSEIRVG